MKLDWNRVKRTFIQAACGEGVAVLTAITADFRKETIIASFVGFFSTVAIAVLMNIQMQVQVEEEE